MATQIVSLARSPVTDLGDRYHPSTTVAIAQKNGEERDTRTHRVQSVAQVLTQAIRPFVVEDLFAQIWNAGCITDSQRQRLMSMSIDRVLCDNEREALDRLFHAIRRGWLKVID